ncbi:hypothetical protein BHM03_00052152 [Ensete ventricosum]|nr:hypothetical protein BHM03_00052152 [Ensete ventricosum]
MPKSTPRGAGEGWGPSSSHMVRHWPRGFSAGRGHNRTKCRLGVIRLAFGRTFSCSLPCIHPCMLSLLSPALNTVLLFMCMLTELK